MSINQRVIDCLVNTLDLEPEDVTLDASLRDDLGIDSLSAVEAAMALEDEFELDGLPTEDVEKARTVQDVAEYIQSRTGDANAQ